MDRIRNLFRTLFNFFFNVDYCERCGHVIWNKNQTRCHHCDFRRRDANEKSWGLFAVGLVLPVIGSIIGIIAAIVCSKKGLNRKAKSAVGGALLGLLLWGLVAVLFALSFN